MDKVICVSSSIALLDWCSSISVKVGEGRLGERGEEKGKERRIGEDKVEKDTDSLKKGLGPLNWSYRRPLSILISEILFKSIVVSKDQRM